jgi:septal ring factor EnvC (AmiA/AmiB activator)
MNLFILFILAFTAEAAREDFPDKEPRFRCNNQKVSACIDENNGHIQYLENEISIIRNQIAPLEKEFALTQTQLAQLEDEYRRYFINSNFLRTEISKISLREKLPNLKIFSDGPTLLELKAYAQYNFFDEEVDESIWNNTLQQELKETDNKMKYLSTEISALSNNIKAISLNLAQFTQEITSRENQKKQHAAMCNSGCKMKFCPES